MTSAGSTPTKALAPGVHQIELGFVSAYLIVEGDDLVLIDAGFPPDAPLIAGAITQLGFELQSLRRIVLTHAHVDHFGAAADLRQLTGAKIMLSERDARQVRSGYSGFGPMNVRSGFEQLVQEQLSDPAFTSKMEGFMGPSPLPIEPFPIDQELQVGGSVEGLEGSLLIGAPGHQAAQVAILLERHGGVLFAGDGAVNFGGPEIAPIAEDLAASEETFHRLAQLDFEIACFGHGEPILTDAANAFRASLPAESGHRA